MSKIPQRYVDIEIVDSLCAYDNKVMFEGYNSLRDGEPTNIELPLTEITDNIDYFIERRIDYITERKKALNNEQSQLKQKLKLWKSLNT